MVTGASRGSASTLVAANLAAALARTGSDVVLIGAHLPDSVVDSAPLARMLNVSAMPGLSDLLAGRVGLTRAMQRSPRIPSLRVITTGGAATAAGLMQSQRLRDTLEALRRQAGYIIIEAPSTSSSADAQSLASLADAAILAVELRKARRPALLDAAEQLRRVGTAAARCRRAAAAHRCARRRRTRTGRGSGPADHRCRRCPGRTRRRSSSLGNDQTQAMRIPTNTVSRPSPRKVGAGDNDDEPTAVIRLAHQEGKGSADGKSDRR